MYIVDNSLCSIDFAERATSKNVREYIASLFQSGVDYAEVDRKAMSYLNDVNTSEKFIFRVEGIEDFEIIARKRFKYLVLPLNMIAIAKKLSALNIMLEVDCDKYGFEELCEVRDRAVAAGCAALRLVSDFADKSDAVTEFLDWNCNPGCLPVNICPLNTSLNGIDTAFNLWNEGGMLTLGFGSPYLYTPYESYFLYQSWRFEFFRNPQNIPFLFAAAAYFSAITDDRNFALENLNNIIGEKNKIIGNIDSGEMKGNIPRPAVKAKSSFRKFTKAQIGFFNRNDIYIEEMCGKLADAADNTDLALYDRFNESKDIKQ